MSNDQLFKFHKILYESYIQMLESYDEYITESFKQHVC